MKDISTAKAAKVRQGNQMLSFAVLRALGGRMVLCVVSGFSTTTFIRVTSQISAVSILGFQMATIDS